MSQVLTPQDSSPEDSAKPVAHKPLSAEQVLRPISGTPHWQNHASLRTDGVDIAVYSRLGEHGDYKNAYAILMVRSAQGGFSLGIELSPSDIGNLVCGLNESALKVNQIRALGSSSEVVEVEDWLIYEQTTGDIVKAKVGGIGFRVFVNQLDAMSQPEVQLLMQHGDVNDAGEPPVPGFLTPDAADQLADALKAAAYRARMLKAEQIAQGGAA